VVSIAESYKPKRSYKGGGIEGVGLSSTSTSTVRNSNVDWHFRFGFLPPELPIAISTVAFSRGLPVFRGPGVSAPSSLQSGVTATKYK
jgi:hypothetical protein